MSGDAPLAQYPQSTGNATLALVLGILGLLGGLGSCCCCLFLVLALCAPVGWYLGRRELQAIRAGRAPEAGRSSAQVGMVCGIAGCAILALYVIAVVLYVSLVGFAVAVETLKQGGLPVAR